MAITPLSAPHTLTNMREKLLAGLFGGRGAQGQLRSLLPNRAGTQQQHSTVKKALKPTSE
jgi:hypothetical protein